MLLPPGSSLLPVCLCKTKDGPGGATEEYKINCLNSGSFRTWNRHRWPPRWGDKYHSSARQPSIDSVPPITGRHLLTKAPTIWSGLTEISEAIWSRCCTQFGMKIERPSI